MAEQQESMSWFRSPSGRIVAAACLASAVVTTGIQALAPAIPAIQDEFDLSAAQVALFTSVYLFPSMFSALLAGALADRIGTRPVFSGALLVYGLGAVVLVLDPGFAVLLAVRFVQGAAFGAVLSMSVGIIGSIVASGPRAARAQGQRIIVMASTEAVLPAAAGAMLALAWYAPFALQLLALPVALLCWLVLPSGRPARKKGAGGMRAVAGAPAFAGVQLLAALRFVFKFAILTYFPLLAVDEVGLSPAVLGVALGIASAVSAVTAWLTEKLAHRWSSAQLIAACLLALVVSVVAMAFAAAPALALLALLLYGIQDGVYGVAHNVLVTELAPAGARATYVGVTGTVRNIGKFTAPMIFGAATLVLTVSQSFLVLAAIGVASLAVTRPVIRAERAAVAGEAGDPAPTATAHTPNPDG
jgi:predicted MFS family arabinose efflux permease